MIPRAKFIIHATIISAVALGAAGYFGRQWLTEREAAKRRAEFSRYAAAGHGLVEEQKFAQAVTPLERAAALSASRPQADDLNASLDLAQAYSGTGRRAQAQKVLEEARNRAASLPAADLLRPEINRCRVDLTTALANLLLSDGKANQAMSLYQWAVTAVPHDAAAHNNLANALFMQGRFAEAEPQYDLAHALEPKNPETLYNWGTMLLQKTHRSRDDEVTAESNFRRALGIDPKSGKYLVGLGRALRAEGRYGPAIQALRTSMHVEPKYAGAYLELADLSVQLRDYQSAESCLRSVLSFERDNKAALVALARLLSATPDPAQRDYLESAMLYSQLIDLSHGQDVNFTVQLADTYALAKYYDKAEETIAIAVKLAREQKLSAVDQELIAQRAQTYEVLQFPPAPASINLESTLDDPLGVSGDAPDPWDVPPPPPPLNDPLVHVLPPG